MAVRAYVLIETHVGKTREVVEAIHKLEGVEMVDMITGPYDAIATLEAETLSEIGDLVTAKIHPVSGISRTVTCLAVKSS
jgi:DNA-binding Lrp family transcriptional regulator